VQDLEVRCLLSAMPVADSLLTTATLSSTTAAIADPSLVQLSTVGTQEIINGSDTSQIPLIYGPIWSIAAAQTYGTPQTPAEDLYDEGAGAVWGTIADEGVYGIVGGLHDINDFGVGAYGGIDTVGDYGAVIGSPDDGAIGAIGAIGAYGDYGDYGDYGAGAYGVAAGFDATGALDSGFDDMGGVFSDGGYGIGAVGDNADDGAIGDTGGYGDYGAGAYGIGDYGAAAGADGMTGTAVDGSHSIVAEDDYASTNEDTTVDIYVLENDHDDAGHSLSVTNLMSTQGMAWVDSIGVVKFLPAPNFHGLASITYKATDGVWFSNQATVTVSVADVNDIPAVANPGNMTFKEGDDVSFVTMTAADADFPNDRLRWSIAGTPPGVTIEVVTGRFRGKLTYASAGLYHVTAIATDQAGASASATFVWTIQDAGFDTLTATEVEGSMATSNSITVPGTRSVLYAAPGNTVSLNVQAMPPKILASLSDVRYEMTGNGTLFVGSFSPLPTLRVGAAGAVYTVTAYLDENLNGAFDAAEFQLTLTIKVVDFGSAKVFGGRVGGGILYPGEDLLFIKAGELFDVTSTFEYKIVPEPDTVLGDGALVRAQLIRPTTGAVFGNSSAIGESFNVLLTSAMAGPAQVRFYLDANFNGVWDMGEPTRTSSPFKIVERNHLTRTYQYSLLLSGLTQGSIQADVDASMELALRKDSDDDWRAAVYTTVAPAADRFFAPSTARPDPADTSAKISLHLDEDNVMTLLKDMSSGPSTILLGKARKPGTSLAIDWDSKSVDVIVNELGHNLGLPHNGLGAKYIMEAIIVGSNDHLSFSEAETYSTASAPDGVPGLGAKLASGATESPITPQLTIPAGLKSQHAPVPIGFYVVLQFANGLPPLPGIIDHADFTTNQLVSVEFDLERERRTGPPESLTRPRLVSHTASKASHPIAQVDGLLQNGVQILDLTPIQRLSLTEFVDFPEMHGKERI